MMSDKDVRHSKIDRRSKTTPPDDKKIHKGLERRSGEERRKWIDRMQEIREKLK
jgi:hypothetical protein